MNKQQLIDAAYAWAIEESTQTLYPPRYHVDLVFSKGYEIAAKLKADKFVVVLGCLLMDIALGDAIKADTYDKHVRMSVEKAKMWLTHQKVDAQTISKVLHCVESHHKQVAWKSLEAEICANVDCYKFLHTNYWMHFYGDVSHDRPGFAEEKFNEKASILSLTMCREELATHMSAIRKIMALSKLV